MANLLVKWGLDVKNLFKHFTLEMRVKSILHTTYLPTYLLTYVGKGKQF